MGEQPPRRLVPWSATSLLALVMAAITHIASIKPPRHPSWPSVAVVWHRLHDRFLTTLIVFSHTSGQFSTKPFLWCGCPGGNFHLNH